MAAGVALFGLYMLIYLFVLRLPSPKTAILRGEKAKWESRAEFLYSRLDSIGRGLSELELRNSVVYSAAYGVKSVPDSVVRTTLPEGLDSTSALASAIILSEEITRRADTLLSRYSRVEPLSLRLAEMASFMPAIPPMNPDSKKYRFSSPYGYRKDPIHGERNLHMGIDFGFSGNGNPLYCTGDGTVEFIREEDKGYGHQVMINHGYGYETRYAHMSHIFVFEGMKLKRGDCLGLSGNTGRSTGPHVHYEVLYNGKTVDPLPFLDLTITPDEYFQMARKPRGR